MKAITVHKSRFFTGMSVVMAVTCGGWMTTGTAGATRIAGEHVAHTVASRGSTSLTANAKSATTVLEPGTIVNDRFVKTFKLSNGALTLAPFQGSAPGLSS